MARIRSIKPEFWQDSRLSRLPTLARCVYLCLWSMSDDEGRIEGDAETVWHFGFPREKVADVSRALANLREASRVVAYEGPDGVPHLYLPTFSKHQKIDHPSASKLPAPPTLTSDSRGFAKIREDSAKARAGSDQGSGIRDQGSDLPDLSGGPDRGVSNRAPPGLPPIVEAWNRAAIEAGAPRVTVVGTKRQQTIRAALKDEPDVARWEAAFRLVAADRFLQGGNDRGKVYGDFDFAIRPDQRAKWLDLARSDAALVKSAEEAHNAAILERLRTERREAAERAEAKRQGVAS